MDSEKQIKVIDQSVQRRDSSVVVPVALIGVGVVWLLSNAGIISNLSLGSIMRLWPVALIWFGFNLISRNVPRSIHRLVDAVMIMCMVGGLGLLIVAGDRSYSETAVDTNQIGEDAFFLDEGTDYVDLRVDFDSAGGEIDSLTDISEPGEFLRTDGTFLFERQDRRDHIVVDLTSPSDFHWDPGEVVEREVDRNRIAVSPDVPTELRVDIGSGDVDIKLQNAQLRYFDLDAGSGTTSVTMPSGFYDGKFDMGSGWSSWVLPAKGQGVFEFDLSSGNVEFVLPATMEAQILLDDGPGTFSADNRFSLVSEDGDDQIWQTAGFNTSSNAIVLEIDQSSGNVSIETPTGR